MVKKVLFLMVGIGMITAGVAGITTSVIDQKHKVALRQLETIQEEAKFAAAQEQKQIEEKRQEMEKLAMTIQEEKQRVEDVKRRIEDERRRAEEARRATLAAVQEQKKAAMAAAAAPKGSEKEKGNEKNKKPTVLAKKPQQPSNDGKSASTSRRSPDLRASRQDTQDEAIKQISQKVGLQAARMLEPVQYHNGRTGELIVAEPVDYGPVSVRVRVRIWRNERLVKDTLINFSEAALNTPPRRRGWGWNGSDPEPGRSLANRM